jgi:hypothetical protein
MNKKDFITGSALVSGVAPKDYDFVRYCDNLDSGISSIQSDGFLIESESSYNNEDGTKSRFVSARRDNINIIITDDVELFYRFKAFSGVLSCLQISNKGLRIELAKACLYWEPKQ